MGSVTCFIKYNCGLDTSLHEGTFKIIVDFMKYIFQTAHLRVRRTFCVLPTTLQLLDHPGYISMLTATEMIRVRIYRTTCSPKQVSNTIKKVNRLIHDIRLHERQCTSWSRSRSHFFIRNESENNFKAAASYCTLDLLPTSLRNCRAAGEPKVPHSPYSSHDLARDVKWSIFLELIPHRMLLWVALCTLSECKVHLRKRPIWI